MAKTLVEWSESDEVALVGVLCLLLAGCGCPAEPAHATTDRESDAGSMLAMPEVGPPAPAPLCCATNGWQYQDECGGPAGTSWHCENSPTTIAVCSSGHCATGNACNSAGVVGVVVVCGAQSLPDR